MNELLEVPRQVSVPKGIVDPRTSWLTPVDL